MLSLSIIHLIVCIDKSCKCTYIESFKKSKKLKTKFE